MTTIRRHPERAREDRKALEALLDEVPFGTLCTVVDGLPWVIPMLVARDGDRLLLHGSTGAGALRHVAAGSPAALCVVSLDGIVVAHTTFESSANYRSAVVQGVLTRLPAEERATALDILSDRLVPGRVAEVRPVSSKELAATLVVSLPITQGGWTLKARTGAPSPPEEETDAWCGVVPVRTVHDQAEAAPWVAVEAPVPDSVRRLSGIPAEAMPTGGPAPADRGTSTVAS